jgi:UDP-N-acetylmuramoyl-L-alanyl-D-glutamate--2,6-diaminopimelate ligase
MQLSKLLLNIKGLKVYGSTEIEICGIFDDSRKVNSEGLFVAIKGLHIDGHKYINDAISKGAVVVVGQENYSDKFAQVTYIQTNDTRQILGELANNWHGRVSDDLKIIGVTGTDGKTTTSHLIYHLLKENGLKVGIISTIGAEINGVKHPTGLHVTSPDTLLLHELLADMSHKKAEYVVLEVTSHGIDQKRISGVSFDIGVLTNITHEHLDYHKTFENYQNTKVGFLLGCPVIIANKDDTSFEVIQNKKTSQKIMTYSLKQKADFQAKSIKVDNGLSFELVTPQIKEKVKTNLEGRYNVSNILAATAVVQALGIKTSVGEKMKTFKLPEGRLENVFQSPDFRVIVDFAHTPNALENTLTTLKEITHGKLIAVFGCAGERDFTKRPKMGEISGRIADISIFTAEDPRSENIFEILAQMKTGAKLSGAREFFDINDFVESRGNQYTLISERHEAIALGIGLAKKDDTVVICGKGHEESMAYGGVEHPWKDQEIVKDILNKKPDFGVVVFSAGIGKRMQSELPKVLHQIAGRPMISYTLEKIRRSGFGNVVMVVGFKKEEVIKETKGAVAFAIQKKPLGTGDALATGLSKIDKDTKHVIALNGDDSGFYDIKTIKEVVASHKKSGAVITFVSLIKDNPQGLGRIVRNKDGEVSGIVEEKDTTEKEKKIQEINVGFYVFNKEWLVGHINKIQISTSGEYYVVDLIKMAISQKNKVNTYVLKIGNEWVGVNTPEQLKEADVVMREKLGL